MSRHAAIKARLPSRADAERHSPLRATVQVGGELLITAGVGFYPRFHLPTKPKCTSL